MTGPGVGLRRVVAEAEARLMMPTYRRNQIELVRGDGTRVWDAAGREYLDFTSGIAVVSVGHCREEVTRAVSEQMSTLVHVTNLFYTEAQVRLAEQIHAIAGWGKVFFSNSGAEANECAIKLARLHARKVLGASANQIPRVVALEGSFHGRTLGSLSATGQPGKQAPFLPLVPGFEFVPGGDLEALERAIDGAAALFVEVIQGEGGVIPVDIDYLKRARELCDKAGALFVTDEIQTGLCRTGRWLGGELAGVTPDIYTLGKALGNGLPIAATVAKPEVADLFSPGDHGTTMGGGPVLCRAASIVLDIMKDEALDGAAVIRGGALSGALRKLDGVSQVRGAGLLLAAELETASSAAVVEASIERGLIVNAVTPSAVRLAPPLTVSDSEIHQSVTILGEAIKAVAR